MEKLIAVATLLILVMGVNSEAALGTANVDYLSGQNFTDGSIKIWGDGHTGVTGTGGLYKLDKSGDTGLGSLIPDGVVNSFCIDLTQAPGPGYQTHNMEYPKDAPDPPTYGFIGIDKQEYLRELWGRYYDTALTSGALAEAFSAAVWEIAYENYKSDASNYDVTFWDGTGNSFKCEDADTATANNWLSSLDGTGPKADLFVLTNGDYQDYLVTPEPASIMLLGFGALALLRKRR